MFKVGGWVGGWVLIGQKRADVILEWSLTWSHKKKEIESLHSLFKDCSFPTIYHITPGMQYTSSFGSQMWKKSP